MSNLQLLQVWGKRFLIFGSLGVFAIFLFVISVGSFRPPSPATPKKLSLSSAPPPTASSDISAIDFLASLPEFAKLPDASINVTKNLATQLAQEFLRRNPNGPDGLGANQKIIAPGAESLVQEFLTNSIKNFDLASIKPNIRDADIHIIENDDQQTLANYIQKFFSILQNSMSASLKNFDAASVHAARQIYAQYITDITRLPAPRALANIHKTYLATLVTTERLLKIFENYEADPVQALTAAAALRNMNVELAQAYTDLALFAANHHIPIVP